MLAAAFRGDRRCLWVIALVMLMLHGPALFTGRVLLPADVVQLMRPWAVHSTERHGRMSTVQNPMLGPIYEYYSWRYQARERIRSGEAPLWNPLEMSGTPLVANSQSAVFYPPNLLLSILPLWLGINLVTALHTLLTGIFFFGLLRQLRLHSAGALAGALIWMLCSLQVVWTEFQTPTAAMCWIPAALWAWERGRSRGSLVQSIIGSGASVGMMLLAGHFHFAFYGVVALAIWALWPVKDPGSVDQAGNQEANSPARPTQLLGSGRRLIGLVAGLALGGFIAGNTLAPSLELARMNFRGRQSEYANSIGLRLPPENLFTLVLPDLLGNPKDYAPRPGPDGQPRMGNDYQGKFQFVEYSAYLGLPGLIFALAGVAFALRRRKSINDSMEMTGAGGPAPWWRTRQATFSVFALIGLLLALGTPLCALFYYLAPGYRQFNATARALSLFCFGMSGLTGYGVHLLATLPQESLRQFCRTITTVTAGLIAVGFVAFPGMAIIWQGPNEEGKPIAWMLSDRFMNYEAAGLGRMLLFALAIGVIAWLIKRASENNETPKLRKADTSSKNRVQLIWIVPVLAAADLLVWSFGFNPATDPSMLGGQTVVGDYLSKTSPSRVVSLENPDPTRAGKDMIIPNFNAVVGYREAQGADSLHTIRYHKLVERLVLEQFPGRQNAFTDPNTVRIPDGAHPFLNMLNVRYITQAPGLAPSSPFMQPVIGQAEGAELAVWENKRAFGEAWFVEKAQECQSSAECLDQMIAHAADLKTTAFIEQDMVRIDPASSSGTLRSKERSAHHIVFETQNSAPGFAVISEPAYPGWRAYLDGKSVAWRTANYVLMGVEIPSGNHRLELRYEPGSWQVGLFASLLAVGILAISVGYRLSLRKPK